VVNLARRWLVNVGRLFTDIRLRMLNNQVARVQLGARLDYAAMIEQLRRIGGGIAVRADAPVVVEIRNVGLRTIRHLALTASVHVDINQNSEDPVAGSDTTRILEYRCSWPDDESPRHAIHPEDTKSISVGSIAIDRAAMEPLARITANVVCYLEDAPAVDFNEDLSQSYREAYNALTKLSQETSQSHLRDFVDRVGEPSSFEPHDS
jgi:hypothetical protein